MSTRVQPIGYTPQVERLLRRAELPTDDLATGLSVRFVGVHVEGALVGVAGLETRGRVGLLRSMAVAESFRGKGIGALLVTEIETLAAGLGLTTLYLLTTTAAEFFLARGYRNTDRSEAPAGIASTKQFSEVCPSSSAFMAKALAADESIQRGACGGRGSQV